MFKQGRRGWNANDLKKKIRINLNEAVIQRAGSEVKTSATISDS